MSLTAPAAVARAVLEPYQFDGIYEPSEVSGYLAAALPERYHPPTPRSIYRWVRTGLVAPERRHLPGQQLVVDFGDLVTCQAITAFRADGLSLQAVRRAMEYFRRQLPLLGDKPFAYRQFWYAPPDLFAELGEGLLVAGTRGGQLAWRSLLEGWLVPMRQKLAFDDATGEATCWEPVEGITLEPNVQFGQPCLKGTRIPTSALWSYVAGGDSPAFVARGYGLEVADVERAIGWEQRVRRALGATPAVSA